jgi:hypothetical protein
MGLIIVTILISGIYHYISEIYGQLNNDKLAFRYKHAPTGACLICGLPDSCTHIAGQNKTYNDQFISRDNAAGQLTHTAIRSACKGGGTLSLKYNGYIMKAIPA